MRILLFILCLFSIPVGLMILAGTKSAIHEIEGFLLFLIGAVFLAGAAVVDAIQSQQKIGREIMKAQREITKALQWMVNNWKDTKPPPPV